MSGNQSAFAIEFAFVDLPLAVIISMQQDLFGGSVRWF